MLGGGAAEQPRGRLWRRAVHWIVQEFDNGFLVLNIFERRGLRGPVQINETETRLYAIFVSSVVFRCVLEARSACD